MSIPSGSNSPISAWPIPRGTGGASYNVLIDLARVGAPFPLFGAGLVGDDALGREILADCRRNKIDTRHLATTTKAPTSYTDVMTELARRTPHFSTPGARNALWRGGRYRFPRHPCPRIFHLGYLLLLDAMDEPDARFGTRAARVLAAAQDAGVKTSIDVVSEDSDRFAQIVSPALKHVDYCILNEDRGQARRPALRFVNRTGRWTRSRCAIRPGRCCKRACVRLSSSIFPRAVSPGRGGARISGNRR